MTVATAETLPVDFAPDGLRRAAAAPEPMLETGDARLLDELVDSTHPADPAALLGVLVPFFFRLVRIDPAIAAGPAVTTIDDIVAIGIYYVVAILLITA